MCESRRAGSAPARSCLCRCCAAAGQRVPSCSPPCVPSPAAPHLWVLRCPRWEPESLLLRHDNLLDPCGKTDGQTELGQQRQKRLSVPTPPSCSWQGLGGMSGPAASQHVPVVQHRHQRCQEKHMAAEDNVLPIRHGWRGEGPAQPGTPNLAGTGGAGLLTPSITAQHGAAGKRVPGAVSSGAGSCLGQGGLHRVLEGSGVTPQHSTASLAPPTQWVQSGRGARSAPAPMGCPGWRERGDPCSPAAPATLPADVAALARRGSQGPHPDAGNGCRAGSAMEAPQSGTGPQHCAGKAGARQPQLCLTQENHLNLAKITCTRCWLSCCLQGSSLTLAQGWHPKVPAPPLPAGSPRGWPQH